jgi:Putative Ig domain
MASNVRILIALLLAAGIGASLAGCNTNGTAAAGSPSAAAVTPPVGADNSISISGSPALSVVAGAAYSFQPTAASANGATLKFAVSNLPAWAKFNASTGAITGTPAPTNVGKTSQIVISASNGTQSAELKSFVITVTESTAVSADLSWTAPTATTVGNLPNLAGFHIHYGSSPASLSHVIDVSDATLTNYTVSDLTHGTWYFAVTAYSSSKVESTLSAVVPVTL